ncbi:MAG TPA: methyltransferase domain-containing protein [Candidatus Sulfotelmatobacter sp.]|nr:methyltransferase domain-containing protein [Candidatus Sulfotelmatobacter sp.]
MITINSPLFCLTSDVDWASDYCISDFLQFAHTFEITPTVFATHPTPALNSGAEIGVHPNFLPGSSHGSDRSSVINHVLSAFPEAKAYRSHHFVDSSDISHEMFQRKLLYDSNLCLHMQEGIVPLQMSSGPIRFPVFWEDDVHWSTNPSDWRVDYYLERFLTPGLKILNIHPFFFAANIPSQEYYDRVKQHVKTLSPETVRDVRYEGQGVRTFAETLVKELQNRGFRFHTLHQLYEITRSQLKAEQERSNVHVYTHEEYEKYWKEFSDEERQSFVRASYNRLRNPSDLYATSPDTNLRDLEVEAIRDHLTAPGTLLDLGCGNGFTFYALGTVLENWDMVGIDFSESLIQGANGMLASYQGRLRSTPKFILADAIAHLRSLPDNSVDSLLTERFLQNLPSRTSQYGVIREAKRVLRPGGRLLMCEGSQDGFDALNDLRDSVGLARIPASGPENVSALRFNNREVEHVAQQEVGLAPVAKVGFSAYFIISRVLHPLLASPQPPRYSAKINDVARKIQQALPKDSTYGSNVLWVYEKC